MTEAIDGAELHRRVLRLEDEAAIRRLVMTYGPAADAGMASLAGDLWLEDGEYDWDAHGVPFQGSAEVAAMLSADFHQGLMLEGVAHFGGPLLVSVDGDVAVALNYSVVMRREDERFYLWRVSAVRWDLERRDGSWRVRRRANRLLDAEGEGRRLLGRTLEELSSARSL